MCRRINFLLLHGLFFSVFISVRFNEAKASLFRSWMVSCFAFKRLLKCFFKLPATGRHKCFAKHTRVTDFVFRKRFFIEKLPITLFIVVKSLDVSSSCFKVISAGDNTLFITIIPNLGPYLRLTFTSIFLTV